MASCQLFPPSMVTSIFDIPSFPAKAMPAIGTLFPSVTVVGIPKLPNLLDSALPGATRVECILYLASLLHPFLCQKPS